MSNNILYIRSFMGNLHIFFGTFIYYIYSGGKRPNGVL